MTVYFDNYCLIDYLAMICFISFLGFCQENLKQALITQTLKSLKKEKISRKHHMAVGV